MSAEELLAEAVEAHGATAYDSASEITARVRCGGLAFPLRFKRGAFADFTGTVSTGEPRAVLSPYPGPGWSPRSFPRTRASSATTSTTEA